MSSKNPARERFEERRRSKMLLRLIVNSENYQQRNKRCIYYNPIVNIYTDYKKSPCEAGLTYDEWISRRSSEFKFPDNFPCMSDVDKEISEKDKAVAEFIDKLNSHICATCNTKNTGYRQSGKCVYSEPCGHRVGQGNAKKLNDSLKEYLESKRDEPNSS